MAFTTPATAKSASDGVSLTTNPVITSLTETLINTEIARRSIEISKQRIYTASFVLDADLNGRVSPIDIIQSDDSKILLTDLCNALRDVGYRIAFKPVKMNRAGKKDKVNLTIAWD